MFEKILSFIQAFIDNANNVIEPVLKEIQRCAITYPDAMRLVAFFAFVIILVAFGVMAIFAYTER